MTPQGCLINFGQNSTMAPLLNHYTYEDVAAMLGDKRMCKVANNTYAAHPTFEGNPDDIHVSYYRHHIITLYRSGAVAVHMPQNPRDMNKAMKDRINRFLPLTYSLYQDGEDWYIYKTDSTSTPLTLGTSYLVGPDHRRGAHV